MHYECKFQINNDLFRLFSDARYSDSKWSNNFVSINTTLSHQHVFDMNLIIQSFTKKWRIEDAMGFKKRFVRDLFFSFLVKFNGELIPTPPHLIHLFQTPLTTGDLKWIIWDEDKLLETESLSLVTCEIHSFDLKYGITLGLRTSPAKVIVNFQTFQTFQIIQFRLAVANVFLKWVYTYRNNWDDIVQPFYNHAKPTGRFCWGIFRT